MAHRTNVIVGDALPALLNEYAGALNVLEARVRVFAAADQTAAAALVSAGTAVVGDLIVVST